jgi:hypothetical protein
MQTHEHKDHKHQHGTNCGHVQIKHGDHTDYIHDGHIHHVEGSHVDEHRIEVSAINPEVCKPMDCQGSNIHAGKAEKIPHGDHIDFLVNGRLHHVHDGHCDDHGPIALI